MCRCFIARRGRAAQSYPWTNQGNYNFDPPPLAGKSDYAGNMGGDFGSFGMGTDLGPSSLDEAANVPGSIRGLGWTSLARFPAFKDMTGVIFQRSEVKIRQITDGTTHTYLLGEKNLDSNRYEDCQVDNDDQSMYNGYDRDNLRVADNWLPTAMNQGPPGRPPVPDTPGTKIESVPVEFRRTAPGRMDCGVLR